MPFATSMVQTHSVVGLYYTETASTNWLYPQNAELFHATGILLTRRDTLSLFVNFGWLGSPSSPPGASAAPTAAGRCRVAAAIAARVQRARSCARRERRKTT